jgi:hypothetical protein
VLFGFNIQNKNQTGYLCVIDNEYKIVNNYTLATKYSLNIKPGKGTPKDWCEFFKNEEKLDQWRFHPVILTKNDF